MYIILYGMWVAISSYFTPNVLCDYLFHLRSPVSLRFSLLIHPESLHPKIPQKIRFGTDCVFIAV